MFSVVMSPLAAAVALSAATKPTLAPAAPVRVMLPAEVSTILLLAVSR